MVGRPPKNEDDKKNDPLRIPMTAAQKEIIRQAAQAVDQDMAAWARQILLEAAKPPETPLPTKRKEK